MNKATDTVVTGDVVFAVDKIDGKYQLCAGVVEDTSYHASRCAFVRWTDPNREPSWRQIAALSTSPVVAICRRNDLLPEELQEITDDAKSRGLLEGGVTC